MSIALTTGQLELQHAARALLAGRDTRALARRELDGDVGSHAARELWHELVVHGWLAVHVPERYGGTGLSLVELAVVLEALGHALAPGPFRATVTASAILARAGVGTQRGRWLPALARGEALAGFGLHGALRRGLNGRVSGDAGVVAGAVTADLLLLAVAEDLVLVETARPGVEIVPAPGLDPGSRYGRVRLDITVAAADTIPRAGVAAVACARALAAAEAAGGARACLETAVAPTDARDRLGPLAPPQPTDRDAPGMPVAAELAAAAAWGAARALAADDPRHATFAAAAAAAQALPAYLHNARLNVQLHGTLGCTWGHDAQLHLRRAASLAAAFGSTASRRDVAALAGELGAEPEPAAAAAAASADAVVQARSLAEWLVTLPPEQQTREVVASGYAQPGWPPPWGLGVSPPERRAIERELDGVAMPDDGAGAWILRTLIEHAGPAQLARWIEPSLLGELRWCELFGEDATGAGAGADRTRAHPVNGGWSVTGRTLCTTAAQRGTHALATVRTDPAAGHAGISLMVIELAAPGVEVRPLRDAGGGTGVAEVSLEDVFVPGEDVVGAPGGGRPIVRDALAFARRVGAAGDMDAAAALARLYAERGGERPELASAVGALVAEARALRLLAYTDELRGHADRSPNPAGLATGLVAAENARRCAEVALDLLDPDAALSDGVGEWWRTALIAGRGSTIGDAASERARDLIAERVRGDAR